MTTAFLAADRSLAVDLEAGALTAILGVCSRAGHRLETGGVLLGHYSKFGDRLVVTKATGPPRDSRRFPFAFIRGTAGLTKRFRRDWEEGIYYVGEWHFHPNASTQPSPTDIAEIKAVGREADYRCPHPTLVILGGDPSAAWSLGVGVVIQGSLLCLRPRIELRVKLTDGTAQSS